MGKRRKSREMAMQMLYQADVGRQSPDEVRRTFWRSREPGALESRGFAEEIFHIATERREEIDALIDGHSEHWRLGRMAAVDRNLLRATVAEMLGFPSVPLPILISEALAIAQSYAAPESVQFLNGVLDAVARDLPRAVKQLTPKPQK